MKNLNRILIISIKLSIILNLLRIMLKNFLVLYDYRIKIDNDYIILINPG
nr:hypothetical protein CJLB15_00038 [Campylobacter phage CJLB-15]